MTNSSLSPTHLTLTVAGSLAEYLFSAIMDISQSLCGIVRVVSLISSEPGWVFSPIPFVEIKVFRQLKI
jgi:hypothetical protein